MECKDVKDSQLGNDGSPRCIKVMSVCVGFQCLLM